jgi:hypothetical protein
MTISLLLAGIAAVGLIGVLGLFVSVKLEFEARSRRERERIEAILARVSEREQPVVVLKSNLNLTPRPQLTRREAELVERVRALAAASGERIC